MEVIRENGGHVNVALTLRDDLARKKSGRVYLDEWCQAQGTELHKVRHIDDAVEILRASSLDWLFIIGWSQIASEAVIATARIASLGIHPTLLPTGRGRAAIPWAILKGLDKTGVSLFRLDAGIDTGPIALQEVLPIGLREDATSLYSRVNAAHRTLMARAWPTIRSGSFDFVEQDETRASVWPGRTPADGRFDATWTCEAVDRLVRATTTPYPGAFIDCGDQRIRVWQGHSLDHRTADCSQPHLVHEDYWLPLSDGVFVASKWTREFLEESRASE